MNRSKFGLALLDYALIVFLGLIDSLSYAVLIVRNFIPMGMNGIAVMIEYATSYSGGWFAWFSLIVNFPFCLLTFIFVDKQFALRSYVYVATLALGYVMWQAIGVPAYHEPNETLIPVIAAGVVSGIIYGFVFMRNASTGGMDVVGKLVAYKKPEFNFIWISFILSAMVAVASGFVMKSADQFYNIKQVFLCIIFSFTAASIGDFIFKGTRRALKVEVVTHHAEEISQRIIYELHLTTTVTHAQGMFRHEEYDLMICIINKRQLVELEKILKAYPDTFAYISQVNSTLGLFNRK